MTKQSVDWQLNCPLEGALGGVFNSLREAQDDVPYNDKQDFCLCRNDMIIQSYFLDDLLLLCLKSKISPSAIHLASASLFS